MLRMTENGSPRVFRFGVFEARAAAAELRKSGIRIKLHTQPFQVLLLLLERPSEVVTREEMRARLWGSGTFVDFDHGLNTAVNKIREALGDSAAQPRYIETVPGKGYRFIAPVTHRPELAGTAQRLGDRPTPVTPPAQAGLDRETPALAGTVLASPQELPHAPRPIVWSLLLLIQAMYLAFYVGALANLAEIQEIVSDTGVVPQHVLMPMIVATAAVLIPVRLFLLAALAFRYRPLPVKFAAIFPALLILDLLWALSPFLLVHHINTGLALAFTATLVYLPFAQRSLMLMYARP